MLPLDLIRECARTKLAETDPLLLQYGYIPGYPAFRKSLAKFLTSRYACDVTDEEVFATTGVTGGLSLICNLFLNAGDDVFAEDPTYFLAMRIFEDFNLNVTQIPMEQNGLDLDALEDRLKGGHIPKALYTIPTAHNPTGRTLAEEKRGRLCELSEQYGFLVIADEVYHMLTFPDVTPPLPLPEFDKGGKVLSLGSFSKILAPALRMGWVQSKNPELLDVMAQCGQLDSSGGMNPVMSAVVHEAMDSGLLDEHLTGVRTTLATRYNTLSSALDKFLPEGCSYEVPDGGYFVLVRLPDDMMAVDVLDEGVANHKVRFLPGSGFGATMQNYLRLSFSMYDPDDIHLGVQRLAAAIDVVRNRA